MTPETGTEPNNVGNLVPSPSTTRTRKRLRGVSIRVLMLVMLVVGGCLGWIAHRARVQREAVAAIEAAGGHVYYDWQCDATTAMPHRGESLPGWLRIRLGPGFFEDVKFVLISGFNNAVVDNSVLCQIGRLGSLQMLCIRADKVTDIGITDEGLKSLVQLSGLKTLALRCTRITDAGMIAVGALINLESLDLTETAVTDAGLLRLAVLKRCQVIDAICTKVTPEGAEAMKAKCPWMDIVR